MMHSMLVNSPLFSVLGGMLFIVTTFSYVQILLTNPSLFSQVDTKIRNGDGDGTPVQNDLKILGWDGSGVVESVGSQGTFQNRFVCLRPSVLGLCFCAKFPMTLELMWCCGM